MAVDGSYESLLELRVVGLDGEGFSLRLPDPKSGRDLFVLIRGRVPSKPGAQLSVYIGAEGLSLKKTLREQGIGSEETLSYMFLPTNLAQAMNLIQGFPVEDEFALDGIVELAGIEDTQTILWMNWPSTLLELTFGDFFNHRVEKIKWPTSLKSLEFGARFNQSLLGVSLPSTLECLYFGGKYDKSLKGVKLPGSLTFLTFGDSFNQSLDKVEFPSGLKTLVLGNAFNQSLRRVDLPRDLQSLSFGRSFDQSLYKVNWPSGMLELEFGKHFNQLLRNFPKVSAN